MTNREAFKKIREFGMIVSLNDGEWRVNFNRSDPRWSAESCYFTDDRDDAINTAAAMAHGAAVLTARSEMLVPAGGGVPSFAYVVRYRWIDLGFSGWTVEGCYFCESFALEAADKIKADVGASDRNLLSVQVVAYKFAGSVKDVL